MENKAKTPKQERTTPEQLTQFVEFCAANPVITSGRNNPRAPYALQKLWEELAASLNSMRGPTKTAAHWKETLCHWKNMVRSRARQAAVHAKTTGGGPPTTSTLSELELRALAVFGTASVSGLAGVRTLGFKSTVPNEAVSQHTGRHQVVQSPVRELAQSRAPEPPESPVNEVASPPLSGPSTSSRSVTPQSLESESPEPTRKRRRRFDPDYEALQLLKESVANRSKNEERAIQAQEATAAALKELAAAMLRLTQAISSLKNQNE